MPPSTVRAVGRTSSSALQLATCTSPFDEYQWTWSCGSNGTLGGAGSERSPMVRSPIVGASRT